MIGYGNGYCQISRTFFRRERTRGKSTLKAADFFSKSVSCGRTSVVKGGPLFCEQSGEFFFRVLIQFFSWSGFPGAPYGKPSGEGTSSFRRKTGLPRQEVGYNQQAA
jgi:hypothetical protein